MVDAGFDVCQQDCNGNNVIHTLIAQTFYNPQLEEKTAKNCVDFVNLVTKDQVRSLLHAENMFSLRPLEFAAQQGACRMVMAIMDIPGIYLHRVEKYGVIQYKWYDVSDYEGIAAMRRNKSPIFLLTYADKCITRSAGYKDMHAKSQIQTWYNLRFNLNLLFIIGLFLIRLLYVICYFVYDMDISFYENLSISNISVPCEAKFAPSLTSPTKWFLYVYLMIHSACIILTDVFELVNHQFIGKWYWFRNIRGRKVVVTNDWFYRLVSFLLAVFVLVSIILDFIGFQSITELSKSSVFFDIFRLISPVLAVWSLLYFVQLLPSIGHFVITIQAILGDFVHFSLVFILFIVPFMHTFQTIINTNSTVGCTDDFDSLFRVFYSLFTVMLNMVDLTSYNILNLNVLLTAHIVFTFIVSIMMINFFIALLSNSVSKIFQYHSEALCHQRSAVALLLEHRCLWLFGSVYRRLIRHYFTQENDKILLLYVHSLLNPNNIDVN